MKKKFGLTYYAINRKHFCVALDGPKYKDLTTGEEFEPEDNEVRPVLPEDLLDSTIVVELSEPNKDHYIRVSYCEVQNTKQVNDLISVDVDKDNRLVGIKLHYPWPAR
jgi:hypothetical protein